MLKNNHKHDTLRYATPGLPADPLRYDQTTPAYASYLLTLLSCCHTRRATRDLRAAFKAADSATCELPIRDIPGGYQSDLKATIETTVELWYNIYMGYIAQPYKS